MKKICRVLPRILLWLLALLAVFSLGTFTYHKIQRGREIRLLKEEGYYNPVSVGDRSLNVALFGNKSSDHTVVGLAGLGSGDFAVSMRKATSALEDSYLFAFVDRAGYGFSDDTRQDMTLDLIVNDYRTALRNAGLNPPYVLMPHSIGGAYATYWSSQYPEEIEGIVFVDGSELSADAFVDEPITDVTIWDRFLSVLAKIGFSRYVLRDYFYHYPDGFTEQEQALGDALSLMTMESIALTSETRLIAQNATEAFEGIISNDIPKRYICASWGIQSAEDLTEYCRWINRQIDINHLKMDKKPLERDDETLKMVLDTYIQMRNEELLPYLEKMGSCELVLLPGDHMIYEMKPEECGQRIREFLDGLD